MDFDCRGGPAAEFGSDCPAQVYSSADYVRSLYHKYLNREPSSNELTQWVWAFQKGTTLADAQVTFLSSDDYFVRQARNPNSFVTGLYAEVLNRRHPGGGGGLGQESPAAPGQREKLVRQFLQAAQQDVDAATAPAVARGATAHGGCPRCGRVRRCTAEGQLTVVAPTAARLARERTGWDAAGAATVDHESKSGGRQSDLGTDADRSGGGPRRPTRMSG